MLPGKVQHPAGLKYSWKIQKPQPVLPVLPLAFPVCVSRGSAPASEPRLFEERGHAYLSCQRRCGFPRHTLEWKHLQGSAPCLFRISPEERGDAHVPVHPQVTASEFYLASL